MSNLKFLPIVIPIAVFFYSCSASTDTRYSKDSEKEKSKPVGTENIVEDDLDINPYKTKIEIPAENKEPKIKIWICGLVTPKIQPKDKHKKL